MAQRRKSIVTRSNKRKIESRTARTLAAAMGLESLEQRQLMTVINVASFGATGSGDSRAAFQAALNSAKPGDTVLVPAGTFNISNTLTIPTGVTFTGASSASSHVNFNLPFQTYGMSIAGNASNVTIENLDLVSNSGMLSMAAGTQYTNIHVIHNRLQFGGTYANGSYVFGIWGHVLNEGLEVNNNYFHDSLKSVRDWEIWYAKDATLDHNTLYNVFDGGHLMEPQDNVSYSYNYGTHIGRMGQEIQGNTASHNLKVVGNTFFDWVNPYYDSFGLSVVNHNAINTLVSDNYLGATLASGAGWGAVDGGGAHRFGYGIEIGAVSATVENNTLSGNWVAGIVSSRNAVVQNNTIYGTYSWGDLTTEGGLDGQGKETLIANTIHSANTGVPAAPANTNDYSSVVNGIGNVVGGSTTPVTTPVTTNGPTSDGDSITGLAVTVLSDTSVKLTWANAAGLKNAQVEITSTVGRQSFGNVALPDGATSATITGLHAGWQLDFEVVGSNTAGASVDSGAVTAQMTGDSTLANSTSPTLINLVGPVLPPLTPVTTGITGLTATVLSDSSVQLTWTNSAAITSAQVNVVSTVGRVLYTPITLAGNVSTVTISNLHPGWQIDFTVVGTLANGSTISSTTVGAQMTGSSATVVTGIPTATVASNNPSSGSVTGGSTTGGSATGGSATGGSPTTVTTQPAAPATISAVTATVVDANTIKLAWSIVDGTQASLQVAVVTTVGGTAYPSISYASGTTSAVISGLHAGWQFDFTVSATTTTGQTLTASPVTAMTTGDSSSTVTAVTMAQLKSASRLLAA